MEKPFFSVVIPLYNKSYSVLRCIKSVLNQTFDNFEVIVIDDGSKDDSLKVLGQICDPRFSVISQSNKGVSVARNRGVDFSKANYVCFLDADDYWEPFFLEKMNNLIVSCPEAVLYCLGHRVVVFDGEHKVEKFRSITGQFLGYVPDFFKASLRNSIANSSKVCVLKSSFYDSGGFPERVVAGEDLFLWIQLAQQGAVAFDSTPCATVERVIDASRNSRAGSLPYPLTFYSTKPFVLKSNASLKLYLVKIGIAHIFGSLCEGDYKEAFDRVKCLRGISFFFAAFAIVFFIVPPFILKNVKR
ncbi:glycosyltransferase family 2 protein [Marinobacter nauticus]|uniref:glycosyltransferase family 2 protein n=1 Tax=Marinobacter nauticus TaxID=2743 RepID=UPI0035161E1F